MRSRKAMAFWKRLGCRGSRIYWRVISDQQPAASITPDTTSLREKVCSRRPVYSNYSVWTLKLNRNEFADGWKWNVGASSGGDTVTFSYLSSSPSSDDVINVWSMLDKLFWVSVLRLMNREVFCSVETFNDGSGTKPKRFAHFWTIAIGSLKNKLNSALSWVNYTLGKPGQGNTLQLFTRPSLTRRQLFRNKISGFSHFSS